MKEEWKDIVGFEGLYKVSNYGAIYSCYTNKELVPIKTSKGYYKVGLYKDNKKIQKRIHRLVAETFIKNDKNFLEVNHKDGNKTNNNVNNLEWCTGEYNIEHAFSNGLVPNISQPKKVKDRHQNIIYDSIRSAANKCGIKAKNISKSANRNSKNTRWEFV